MIWDIYMFIISVAYFYQGGKSDESSLIQIKVKNYEIKRNSVEIIFYMKLYCSNEEKNC